MSDFNHCAMIGRLGQDPTLRYMSNNTAVVSFSLAVSDTWTKDGEKQERTNWISCEAFGKAAEIINQYMTKGRRLHVSGKLRMDQWTDKDGGNRSKLKVVVESFQFIDGKQDGGSQRSSRAPLTGADAHEPVEEDDIPF